MFSRISLDDSTVDDRVVKKLVSEDLEEVNQQMSTYLDDSEISRFNRMKSRGQFAISPWFVKVVKFSLELADLTGGPLILLWVRWLTI